MLAARVHQYGGPDVITLEDIARPSPGDGEVIVRVGAAGVGPWDIWVRTGRSVLRQPLPLTLGSDLSGEVVEVGAGVHGFAPGQHVFGVTNELFIGAYAEYAVARAAMIATKPAAIGHLAAASVPVVAVTALQMVVDLAGVRPGQRVLVLGAGGNVGGYAVQLARLAGGHVTGADFTAGVMYASRIGADEVIDMTAAPIERASAIDVVIDTVGGDLAVRALATLSPGGVLVSSVAQLAPSRTDVRVRYLIVDVTSAALERIARELQAGSLVTNVGTVLSLGNARRAHDMLEGRVPHLPGKLVLAVDSGTR
jgi:NADPH:quinone reductase-like Zn-dependent oxidoreductase